MIRFAWFLLSLLVLMAGCASVPSSGPSTPFTPAPDAANVNLQGFPLEYRQGYADGCSSSSGTERRDAARYANDSQYHTGWQDGLALCRKR
ncbi:MAG TPA: hypothetical protein VMU79_00305 [Casimicrobiaceae bacterium]|nr:hypothetical protein [Casimicrobiaceae bacterium]